MCASLPAPANRPAYIFWVCMDSACADWYFATAALSPHTQGNDVLSSGLIAKPAQTALPWWLFAAYRDQASDDDSLALRGEFRRNASRPSPLPSVPRAYARGSRNQGRSVDRCAPTPCYVPLWVEDNRGVMRWQG